MTRDERVELVMLLNEYMNDLLILNRVNRDCIHGNGDNDAGIATYGLRSQYNHARCIARVLARQVEGRFCSTAEINRAKHNERLRDGKNDAE